MSDTVFKVVLAFNGITDSFDIEGVFTKPEEAEAEKVRLLSIPRYGNAVVIDTMTLKQIKDSLVMERLHSLAEVLLPLLPVLPHRTDGGQSSMACDHTLGVGPEDGGCSLLLASAVVAEGAYLRRRYEGWGKNPHANPVMVEKKANYTDAQFIMDNYTLFSFCPDCGEKLPPL